LIGPIFLREGLVAKFKDHISSVPYCIVIHNAKRYSVSVEKKLATEEVSSIVNHFLSTRYPIVCSAGSKSSIPFWDYHIALTGGNNDEDTVNTATLDDIWSEYDNPKPKELMK